MKWLHSWLVVINITIYNLYISIYYRKFDKTTNSLVHPIFTPSLWQISKHGSNQKIHFNHTSTEVANSCWRELYIWYQYKFIVTKCKVLWFSGHSIISLFQPTLTLFTTISELFTLPKFLMPKITPPNTHTLVKWCHLLHIRHLKGSGPVSMNSINVPPLNKPTYF